MNHHQSCIPVTKQRSTGAEVRDAADTRKCCATGAIQKNGHGFFLRYSKANDCSNFLIPLLERYPL